MGFAFLNFHRGSISSPPFFEHLCEPPSSKGAAHDDYSFIRQFEDYLWKTFEYSLADLKGASGAIQRWIVNARYTLDLQDRMTRLHGV